MRRHNEALLGALFYVNKLGFSKIYFLNVRYFLMFSSVFKKLAGVDLISFKFVDFHFDSAEARKIKMGFASSFLEIG